MKVNRVDSPPPLKQAMTNAIFLANTNHVFDSASNPFQLQVFGIYLTVGS
jgi:hypothetical protein